MILNKILSRSGVARRASDIEPAKPITVDRDHFQSVFNSGSINKPLINNLRGLRSESSSRLEELRASKEGRLKSALQPGLQKISEEQGLRERELAKTPMGSRSSALRTSLQAEAGLARQSLTIDALGSILSQENGAQELEFMFNDMFNESGSKAFAQELIGLGVEVNNYLSEQGLTLSMESLISGAERSATASQGQADRFIRGLQSQSAAAAKEMAGRFISAASMEFGRYPANTPSAGYESGAAAGDAYMPAFQQRFI